MGGVGSGGSAVTPVLQREGLHPKKAAGQQWGEAASRGSRGPRGAGYWGPLKARLLGPQALGGLLRHHFTEGKGPGLDTLVKQSMSSRVPDSRPSLDLSLRPSLQQDGAVTVSSPSPPRTGAGPEQKGRRQPPPTPRALLTARPLPARRGPPRSLRPLQEVPQGPHYSLGSPLRLSEILLGKLEHRARWESQAVLPTVSGASPDWGALQDGGGGGSTPQGRVRLPPGPPWGPPPQRPDPEDLTPQYFASVHPWASFQAQA